MVGTDHGHLIIVINGEMMKMTVMVMMVVVTMQRMMVTE